MSNLINLMDHLKPFNAFTITRLTGMGAISIINAGILANDNRECVNESKRIYKNGKHWQSIKRDARLLLADCTKHGLTLTKPYLLQLEKVYVKGRIPELKKTLLIPGHGQLIAVKSWAVK